MIGVCRGVRVRSRRGSGIEVLLVVFFWAKGGGGENGFGRLGLVAVC